MHTMILRWLPHVLLVMSSAILCASTAFAERIAILNATIVDPASAAPKREANILVEGDRIVAIGRRISVPKGARVVDAKGKFVAPGLWDMHAHLLAIEPFVAEAPEHYVGYGVLGVRDMGGYLDKLQALKADISTGKRIGPAIVMAGPTLNGPPQPAPFHRVVATDAEARAAVRELKIAGVDFIKIHRQTTREAFFAIADETKKQGLTFAGHVPLVMGWVEASNAGMHTIEHIQTIFENLQPDPKKIPAEFPSLVARLQGAEGDAIWAAMIKSRTYFDPTLSGFEFLIDKNGPEIAAKRAQAFAAMKDITRRAAAARVPILSGTDILERHGEMLLRELELLIEVGLTPREALAAATTTPVEAMGIAGPGRVAQGAPASFLIVDADPTVSVTALRQLSYAVLRGRLLTSTELSALRNSRAR